jgi:hypothetical protein
MDVGLRMRRVTLTLILTSLFLSLFLLSALSSILAGYPIRSDPREDPKERTSWDTEEEPSVLLFKVSPATPQLYWRVWSADYYTGLDWLKTTDEKPVDRFPQLQDANATRIFTVEINSSQREVFLPVASANSTLAHISLEPIEGLEFYTDTVGNLYKVINDGQLKENPLVYNVSWRDVEVDDRFISVNGSPQEILDKYLQLPNIPPKIWELAKDLEDSSYSVLDQILADVQYLRTNFVYEVERSKRLYERVTYGSDISSYIERGRGVCIDAATALAVILRIQNIPARISIGFKPGGVKEGKLLYYTTGAHSVTEAFLPPYGWVQFDATPPLEENPLVKVMPFKKESAPGSKLFCQLGITNRQNLTDNFKVFVSSKQEWDIEAAPEKLRIEAFQTADALLKVTIPSNANLGEKNVVTVTAVSMSHREVAFSIWAIIQVEDILHVTTTTTLRSVDETVIRGDTFLVDGRVLAADSEQVDNMTIFVFLTKDREAEGILVGKGYSQQGAFQVESAVPYYVEIGDYKVVSISLGTTQYAPSHSDSIIRVRATTRMELGSEDEFLLGYGAIHGQLLWDNGTGFANAPISLEITSLNVQLAVGKLQNLTFNDGSFRIATTFGNSGMYELKAMFFGNEYVLGSNATHVVKLEYGLPEIQIHGEKTAIRGEIFNITGTIQFEGIGVWGEPADVIFDNQMLATIETKANGSYAWSFLVGLQETLGSHNLTVTLEKHNLSAVHEVVVKSKTTLTTKASGIAGGMFLVFSASLRDDHDQPIPGAEIIIDEYGLSWKTDRNGNLTFFLDTIKLWPENSVINARFEGSMLYSPDTTAKEVVPEPVVSLPFAIPLFSSVSVVIAFICVKQFKRRRQALRQTTPMEAVEEPTAIEDEFIHRPHEMKPLRFVLPDIDAAFPNVWGVNDKLRIEIVLDENVPENMKSKEVEILIDEEVIPSVRFSQKGCAELSHVFAKKGEHKVRASVPSTLQPQPLNAEIKIRVVDYGEEIIRLYNEFLRKLGSYGIRVQDEMTAREIERLVLNTGNFDSERLREATTCFEKAEYSNHLIARKDYEIIYLSLKRLLVDVD